MAREINILFTSVGRRSYLVKYFRNALDGEGKIHVANSSKDSPAFQAADKCVVTPLIYNERYIDFLLNYCIENRISIIIPLFDIDLYVLAKHKKEFEKIGTVLLVSEKNIVEICNDKYKTYKYLLDIGIHTPNTYLLLEEVQKAVADDKCKMPLIIKPRWGMGSIGIYEAADMNEMEVFYKKLDREIEGTYLRYESRQDKNNKVIIQSKMDGTEYGLDVINNLNGEYKTTICKIKYAMRAGETDCAMTVHDDMLTKLGEKIGKAMKHVGNMDVDVIVENGVPFVLEMNARFGGGYPFSHMSGVDLPKAIISWLRNETEPEGILTGENNVKSHKDISMVTLS